MDASIETILSVIKSATESVSDFTEEMSEAEESISFYLVQVFFLDSSESVVISFLSSCLFHLLTLRLEEAVVNNSDYLIHPLHIRNALVQLPE